MKKSDLIMRFLIAFVIVFALNAAIIFIWNLLVHGHGTVDWSYPIIFGLVFGIAIPVMEVMRKKRT